MTVEAKPAVSSALRGSLSCEGGAFPVFVAGRRDLCSGIAEFELGRLGGQSMPPWRPGAHIDVIFDDGLERQYSLCGDPGNLRSWRIAVLEEVGGRGGSLRMHREARPGTELRARGPRNLFALVDARRYIFIAGGIGITPIRPMIAEAEASGADWSLLYGGRTRASMAYLTEVAAFGPQVVIVPEDEQGRLDLDPVLSRPVPGTVVYCCGPESLLQAVEARCQAWPGEALHVERFAGRDTRSGPDLPFAVELRRTGRNVTVPADRSILEVAAEAGGDVAYSCREGLCGSCETTVLSGIPDHRDSILTPAERAANDTMMICVSRCRQGPLVLDL